MDDDNSLSSGLGRDGTGGSFELVVCQVVLVIHKVILPSAAPGCFVAELKPPAVTAKMISDQNDDHQAADAVGGLLPLAACQELMCLFG